MRPVPLANLLDVLEPVSWGNRYLGPISLSHRGGRANLFSISCQSFESLVNLLNPLKSLSQAQMLLTVHSPGHFLVVAPDILGMILGTLDAFCRGRISPPGPHLVTKLLKFIASLGTGIKVFIPPF